MRRCFKFIHILVLVSYADLLPLSLILSDQMKHVVTLNKTADFSGWKIGNTRDSVSMQINKI